MKPVRRGINSSKCRSVLLLCRFSTACRSHCWRGCQSTRITKSSADLAYSTAVHRSHRVTAFARSSIWSTSLRYRLLSSGENTPSCGTPCFPEASRSNFKTGRSARTALEPSSPLGWAEIRHPFHPLRGRRFEVLKKRRIAGVDTLILRELERGSFSVAREWTDWADPSPYDSLGFPPRRLDAESLFELATLVEQLTSPEQKG